MKGCFPYLDDITIVRADQTEHDKNLKVFLDAAAHANITLNEKKTQLSQSKIRLLGYEASSGCFKPDPSRVQPLFDLPIPRNAEELQGMIGLFAYYACWVANYSDKVRPLLQSETFSLPEDAVNTIEVLKQF